MQKFSSFVIVILVVILITNCKQASNPEITKEEFKDHIAFLASDSVKGREPGTAGDKMAAEYIRDFFKASGLKLAADDGFQHFEVVKDIELGENNSLSFDGFEAVLKEDFIPFSFSSNADLEAEVIFAGYGFDFSTDSISWNDYDGMDVKDKWVMILRGDPEIDDPESWYEQYSDERGKALTAKDRGAAGVLFVSGPTMSEKDELVSLYFDKSLSGSGIPLINIKRVIADTILKSTGFTVADLAGNLDSLRTPHSFGIPIKVKVSTELNHSRVTTQNVIGIIESDDPDFNNEYILIGAHYDHLGMGGPGSGSRKPDTSAVHNGADDNASGVAGIMEIARNLSANKSNLKRSVIVMAFGAEEMGVLGSKHFIENPVVDLNEIKAMVNLDMIGRLKPDTRALLIGGTGTSLESEDILNGLSGYYDLAFNFSPEGYGASDHSSFYGEEIPVFFISTGAHGDYHTPEDDLEFIDIDGAFETLLFVDSLMYVLSATDSALTFQLAGPKVRSNRGMGLKVTLGIMPDFASNESDGLGVDGVRPGGPAALGGMLKGDIIVAINGKVVTNIYDYMHRLKKLELGQSITVDVLRNDKKEVLLIQL